MANVEAAHRENSDNEQIYILLLGRVIVSCFPNVVRVTAQRPNPRFPQPVRSLTPVWSVHHSFKNDVYRDEGNSTAPEI